MANKASARWIVAVVVLSLLAITFMVVMTVYIVKYQQLVEDTKVEVSEYMDVTASSTEEGTKANEIFSDLTSEQYRAIKDYMFKQTSYNLIDATKASINDSYIFTVEAIVPPKADVTNYLDGSSDKLVRKAKVTMFLGGNTPKSVKEVSVYPIDKPTNIEDFVNPGGRVPSWKSKPYCEPEKRAVYSALYEHLEPLTPMLKVHYGQWLDSTCDEATTCLLAKPEPGAVPEDPDRHIWMVMVNSPGDVIAYYIWPNALTVLLYTPGNGDAYLVKSLYYDNIKYNSVQELVEAYNQGNVRDLKSEAKKLHGDTFGSPKRRGNDVNPCNLPPPVQNTEVRRFSVDGHHVEWLGWQFDFAFSSIGPAQLYNLGFNGERIAYQMGLQDVMVRYTGPEPNAAFRLYMDVSWAMGLTVTPLVKGYDCPESAEYISTLLYNNSFDEPTELKNVACVFEYRNHVPLRRHHSESRFTMSMTDVVLVFRHIMTIFNYDYIADVEIHQTGVITGSVHPTGYIQVFTPSAADGIKYGYNLLPDPGIVGIAHTHLFDYKVDLDIGQASSNRFMTVDFESESRPHPYNPSVNISYTVLNKSMKSTEQEAIIKYDFTKPREYVIYNQEELNHNNLPMGYRIQSGSFVYPIIPETDPLASVATWNHHQIAVTKQKDVELTTLSYYSQGDPYNPLISLKYFQEDNESIVDEDLVCWVSLGVSHIPTSEDIPVTTTAGKTMSFSLVPHNYYTEDPSIASRDGTLSCEANWQSVCDNV